MVGIKDHLLGDERFYPDAPGWKVPGPSKLAAQRIAAKAKSQTVAILALLRTTPGGLTSDEVARRLGFPNIRDSRPRLAELRRQGKITAAGERRGESGLQITVWKVAPPLPSYPHISGEDR
jgi:hypothetical protein